MSESTGKVKGSFAEHKDTLLGAAVICGVVGLVAGVLVSFIGGIEWALGSGIVIFLLLGSAIAYLILSDLHGPPTEGNVDERGYRHGCWIWKNDDDQLLREDNYVHGVKDGLQIRWHENGNKHQEIPYRNGKLHGAWTDWYENGNKEAVDTYEVGLKKGQHLEWYESGEKKKECCYRDDEVPHGDWSTWHENGQKRIEANFEYGTPVGTWTEWDSEGSVLCQRDFEAGIQYGKGRRYFSDFDEPTTTRGNVLALIVAVAAFAFPTYQQIQPFPFLLALFLIVAIHELGHFVAAKLVGIPISHFVIGAGPRLFGFHFGPTSYELKLLPIMGYVKAYELRRGEFRQVHSTKDETEDSTRIDPSELRSSTIEFVSRPRRLVFFLGGVVFNFATVLAIAIVGWSLKNPDGDIVDAVAGTFAAIWALTPVIGNSKDYMSGFGVLMATGLTVGTVGLLSLVVACFNLVPIPPLDGFHVARISIATLIRREVPETYLLPLKVAGACLVAALLIVETVFISDGVFRGIKLGLEEWQLGLEEWHTPPIIGRPESAVLFDGPVQVEADKERRKIPANGMRLLAVVLKLEGEKTLVTDEYVVVATLTGGEHKPLGVLFGRRKKDSVFRDHRGAERVELSLATTDSARMAVTVDLLTKKSQMTEYALFKPYVTLLYEVGTEDKSFELHYDGATYDLALTD